ncbi:MAG: ornithine--oxo-acid transaminase [candidate division WOR-3 bacterium]|nr:ornithine--oxo-acid transaminase [candidate division WOR-3 bacterium]
MTRSEELIKQVFDYSARNYNPLPVVLSRGAGVWVYDVEGKKYLDMLSSYSALNQGHCHPKIVQTLKEQSEKLTLTSRAFHNDQFPIFCRYLCEITRKDKVLLMNTGAEAVETAIKAARKWGYLKKKVKENCAEIIVCENNFHGRTTTIISFSSEEQYRLGFGPYTPGFKIIPYDDLSALENAINPNTVGFLVEPIQGEGGVIIPKPGYLKKAQEICQKHNVLFILDEIQTGLGRTGKLFAYEYEDAIPDILILGKALGGGVYPVSAICANDDIMDVFTPGDHGSTFGGNPLACAVGMSALDVIMKENLIENARIMGEYFISKLNAIKSPCIQEIRGKGLLIGVEIKRTFGKARPFCEQLMAEGILAKETHDYVIRFAPPLIIKKEDIDWAIPKIEKVLTKQ